MCGIVGLYIKNPELEESLGDHLSSMLIQMTDRGPDSAGVAFYAWERLRFNHAIWHVFVLGGSGCHFLAMIVIAVPPLA